MKVKSPLKHIFICILIFGSYLNISLWNISNPSTMVFDEIRYVSAGRQFFSPTIGVNENWSHPPLAKYLIGVGIHLIGDTPTGWRFMNAVFGGLTLVVFYLLGLLFFKRIRDALFVVLLCFANQMLFVNSRIAMMDVFMFFFMSLGFYFYFLNHLDSATNRNIFSHKQKHLLLLVAGINFGLGISCKWFSIIGAFICFLYYISFRFDLRKIHVRRSWVKGIGLFFVLPVSVYLLSCGIIVGMVHPVYAPALRPGPVIEVPKTKTPEKPPEIKPAPPRPPPTTTLGKGIYAVTDLFKLQIEMLKAQLKFSNVEHPYYSHWSGWPIIAKPIWFERNKFNADNINYSSGVLFIGNPLVLWCGLLAILFLCFKQFRRDSPAAHIILFLYFGLWLSWAILPRGTTFFYYYYPPGMILSLALVQAWRELGWSKKIAYSFIATSLLTFVFYYPILTNAVLNESEFNWRLFFNSWN